MSSFSPTIQSLVTVTVAYLWGGGIRRWPPPLSRYSQLLPDGGLIAVQTEYMRWLQYWERQPATVKRPDSVVEALRVAAELGTYLRISILLRILKNYLRSTMGEERLNGLAHMYINRDISLNYEKVIDEFGKFNRRLSFV